jgi:hypothetical protein
MADILPKMKIFIFLSVFQLLINLAISMTSLTFDLIGWFAMIGTAFLPFSSLIPLAIGTNFPLEVKAFIGIFITIISGIQLYMIGSTIWSLVPFVDA